MSQKEISVRFMSTGKIMSNKRTKKVTKHILIRSLMDG